MVTFSINKISLILFYFVLVITNLPLPVMAVSIVVIITIYKKMFLFPFYVLKLSSLLTSQLLAVLLFSKFLTFLILSLSKLSIPSLFASNLSSSLNPSLLVTLPVKNILSSPTSYTLLLPLLINLTVCFSYKIYSSLLTLSLLTLTLIPNLLTKFFT